jgi:hypothetical protein
MTSGVYTHGLFAVLTSGIGSADVRCLLVDDGYAFDRAHNFVSDVVAAEYAGTNYARKTVASEALTEDDTNHWVKFSSENQAWTALGANATAASGIVFYIYNAADSAAILLGFCDFTDVNGNGGDFVVACPANGWFYITS